MGGREGNDRAGAVDLTAWRDSAAVSGSDPEVLVLAGNLLVHSRRPHHI